MKRLMYFWPIVALAMASCSNEVLNQQNSLTQTDATSDALVIRPVVQGATRGTVTTDANFDSFHAVATPTSGSFCTDAEGKAPVAGAISADVVKNGSKWLFDDGNTYYWQSKSTEATFSAYAPKNLNQSGYTVNNTVADQEDVIVAYNEGAGSDFTSGVPMNFQHVMSQIIVKALNKDAATFKIEVAGVKLYNVVNKGDLTLPTVVTASPFDWSTYPTVWTIDASSSDNYTSGSTMAAATPLATLTTVASDILASTDGPMILMPQQLTPATAEGLADQTNSGTKAVAGTYLSVLIRATDMSNTVPELDKDGNMLTSDGQKVPFDSDSNDDSTNDTYSPTTLGTAASGSVEISGTTYNLSMINEVKYPREGYGNNSSKYAYVCVPIDTKWLPGYKYTYTLNFSKDGIGKIDPNFADGYPTGVDYPGGTGGLTPGEDVIDNPIPLYFTVTVDSWTDATDQPLDM